MNYKVLAISAVIGVGVMTVGLLETQRPALRGTVERLTSMDVAEPAPEFSAMQVPDSYPRAERVAMPASLPSPAELSPEGVARDEAAFTLPAGDIPVGLPQIAYVFTYGFRLDGHKIPALQQRHADLCESRGPQICRIIAMEQTGSEGDYAGGTLQLAVASSEARDFGKRLANLAEGSDGEQISAAISGEDVSKSIVDTEARLRARTLLRDRLMEVLATRRGTVTELVEAERGVAQVNEEIDQARSWLSEMKNRVAYSRLDISYQSSLPASGGFLDPARGAVGSLGAIFGSLLAVLIVLGALAIPLLAGWLGGRVVWRRLGWQWPRTAPAEA